jgi:hypothetical protein
MVNQIKEAVFILITMEVLNEKHLKNILDKTYHFLLGTSPPSTFSNEITVHNFAFAVIVRENGTQITEKDTHIMEGITIDIEAEVILLTSLKRLLIHLNKLLNGILNGRSGSLPVHFIMSGVTVRKIGIHCIGVFYLVDRDIISHFNVPVK